MRGLLACCSVLGFPSGFTVRDKCLSGIFMEIYMSVWMSQKHKFLPKTCGVLKPELDLEFSCMRTCSCHIIPCNANALADLMISYFYSLYCEITFYSAIAPKEVTFKDVDVS